MNHRRIVTPYTGPDRCTDEEKVLFDKGLCGKKSKPGASFGHCAEHEARLLEDHWPDGSPQR